MGQPLIDGLFQFGDGMKGSSTNHAFCNQSEPALNLVKPGAGGGGEVNVKSAALHGLEPALDGAALMGAVIVDDEVHVQVLRHFFFQLAQEADKFSAAMAGQAAPHDLPIQN